MTEGNKDRQTGIQSLKLEVNGHRVHYLKSGSGPPVVLIHGGASDSRDWLDTLKALSHRYTLYAPDLLGFGQTDRNKDAYYLSDFTDFLLEFFEVLGLEQTIFVGHSFGGRICLDVALRYPEKVRKLILLDSVGLGKVSRFGTVVLTGFWLIRNLFRREQPFPQFLATDGDNTHWLCDKELPALKMPTLLVWKRHDIYLPVSLARRAVKLIPKGHLAVLPGYGHAPHEQNKDAFNRLLLDFFDRDRA